MQIMEKQSTSGLEYTLLCGLSSFVATLASGIVHPLELIKTRFQSKSNIKLGHDGSHN